MTTEQLTSLIQSLPPARRELLEKIAEEFKTHGLPDTDSNRKGLLSLAGAMRGKITVPDWFDEPLEDVKE